MDNEEQKNIFRIKGTTILRLLLRLNDQETYVNIGYERENG